MKEGPILFSTEMVRAVLDRRKNQTRRVITKANTLGFSIAKKLLDFSRIFPNGSLGVKVAQKGAETLWRGQCKWQPGDRLYVRETFSPLLQGGEMATNQVKESWVYKADFKPAFNGWVLGDFKWKPSIHMPKEASRIWLEVKEVSVERVQDITPCSVLKEGLKFEPNGKAGMEPEIACEIHELTGLFISPFRNLWNSIYKSRGYGWEENPWVWVVKFEVLTTNGNPYE